ncbi:hypothetical protein H2200_002924 [Cladophialophora chaetospira]|uniref:Uncharacterized protein n=1 Tax=Cladophialophora chaetospira TaxID=386627 RepID=A0AA38XGD2_9EURO|nr:hypothetical protein H2200_002924 [Cladophialophora chaetospira]
MPTVLGVPLPSSSTITVTSAASPELFLAAMNTLIWLLMIVLLYIQILENRRIGAHLTQQLEKKGRVYEELIIKASEGMDLRERQLEPVPEVDETEQEQEREIEVVPGRRHVLRDGVLVEHDLRRAMIEELSDPAEDGRFESPEDEDQDLREAMVDELLERGPGQRNVEHREWPGEDDDSDDGLEMVHVSTRGLPDIEDSPLGRW